MNITWLQFSAAAFSCESSPHPPPPLLIVHWAVLHARLQDDARGFFAHRMVQGGSSCSFKSSLSFSITLIKVEKVSSTL